jgi:hypothetical protein
MSLSLSPPCLLICSGPLPPLSLNLHCTWSSPLSLSLSPSVTAPTTTPCRCSTPAVCRPGGCSDEHPVPRFRRPPRVVRHHGSALTTTLRSGDHSNDEEALRWAALERLPTHPTRHRGLPPCFMTAATTTEARGSAAMEGGQALRWWSPPRRPEVARRWRPST